MRVGVIQLSARYARTDEALARARELAARAPADLILLPETSLTGYVSPKGDFDLSRFAEPLGGPLTRSIVALARDLQTVIAAPFVEKDESGALYNSFIVVDRSGETIATYRKRHPWFPETWATPGAEPHPTFAIGDRQITIAICYDIHFLANEAGPTLTAADVLLFPSAWVEDGKDSRPTALPELARAHEIAILNANWCAGDVRLSGQGGSLIIDRSGLIAARAGTSESSIFADV